MRKKIIKEAAGFAVRILLAYLAGRAITMGQEHEKRSQQARDRATARRLARHPSRRGVQISNNPPQPFGSVGD
jgi:hypothetical protein